MHSNPLEPQSRLALYYSRHPELLHADRAAEREAPPSRRSSWSLRMRALRAHLRLARRLRAARTAPLAPGRASL
ncbi:hypothetical protein QQX10_03415 [Demequina sp. SYSU T00039]|uniref:Uncharacterized protein n=1 Tax=Demequina lignilytica TaxID=3051663 RepID=A0AAW7M2L4_9MICO|nr:MULTISPECIES: hypothetical protein [unclassified Demequina]MDN4477037.1 hypothetical protein [Demequina sp. SYSU T00039-1]MDN4487210.1 hypothetical protein [Demequina sp. SYSU T00039]MDN4491795.1 hypothetical protein [Demequina sp. SYSU T00068]